MSIAYECADFASEGINAEQSRLLALPDTVSARWSRIGSGAYGGRPHESTARNSVSGRELHFRITALAILSPQSRSAAVF
jgi:hypothetical protein